MTLFDSIRTCFAKYVTFSGRASRPEFWWFTLAVSVSALLAAWLDRAFKTPSFLADPYTDLTLQALEASILIATIVPAVAVTWRRLHDLGRSGMWIAAPAALAILVSAAPPLDPRLSLIPLGAMVLSQGLLMIWLARPSAPLANRFGPNPNEVHP